MIIGPVSNVKGCIAVNMGQPGCPRPLPVRAPGGPITGWGRGNRVAPGPCLWGRRAAPPPVGGGASGLPQAPACEGGKPFSRPCGCAAQHQNENICSWEGGALPNPPLREGVGETWFPHVPTAVGSGWHPPQAGVWGNPVSPYVHLRGYHETVAFRAVKDHSARARAAAGLARLPGRVRHTVRIRLFASHSLAHVDPFRFSFVGPC